jgi:hypothetical protein
MGRGRNVELGRKRWKGEESEEKGEKRCRRRG